MVGRIRTLRAAPLALSVAAFVVGSGVAYSGGLPGFAARHGVDKVLHATAAGTLTFFLARVLAGRAWLAAALVLVPLAIDEYMQRYSPLRSSDWGDLAADAVGALAAAAFVRLTAPPR